MRLRSVLTGRLVTRLHYASLAVAFAALLWYMRRQYFTEDDWEFIHRLIPRVDNLGLFVPHNEHWSTLPLLIYRALFAVVGLRSYVPYMAVLLALHVLAAHLLWRIMLRAGADVIVATAVAAVFLVLGTGAENLDWAFQICFVGALAAGLGMILAVLDLSNRRLAVSWLLGVAGMMCSGVGAIMVAAAGLTVLLRFGWRRAFLIVVVPAAVFATWWLIQGRHPATPSLPHGALRDVPDYVFTGITSAAQGITGLRIVGALLLIPLAWWLIVRARRSPRSAPVVALAATTLLFFLLAGVGRVGLGVGEAKTSRYVYITAVLLLPALGLAASHLSRQYLMASALVALAVAWAAAYNARALVLAVNDVTGVREHAQARVIAASRLVHGAAVTFPGSPEPATAPDLSWSDLVYLVDHTDLPTTSILPPSEFDTVSVEANLEMSISPVPNLPTGAVAVRGVAASTLTTTSSGCVQVSATNPADLPTVQLVFDSPASVAIHAPAGSALTVLLYPSVSSLVHSPPHEAVVDASGTAYLDLSVPGAAPLLELPRGGASLCAVMVAP